MGGQSRGRREGKRGNGWSGEINRVGGRGDKKEGGNKGEGK